MIFPCSSPPTLKVRMDGEIFRYSDFFPVSGNRWPLLKQHFPMGKTYLAQLERNGDIVFVPPDTTLPLADASSSTIAKVVRPIVDQ